MRWNTKNKEKKESVPPQKLDQSYRQYLLTIALASLFSWAAWTMAILRLDPYEKTGIALSLFFVSLFFALIGTFTLLGFGLRRWLGDNEISYHHLTVSLRQGLLLSLSTLVCLGLLILGVLKWWNGLLIIAIALLFEMLITSRNG
ncbi:MAG: hypothetical protein ACD_28C00077G0003 [uncultured bacterium]|nr:MAG: hypothetical protein ACD_28C00077G0003 [uncultured bacterium]KKT75842.1 MAG: hypothetical protein UW70_C0027G0028 [Candidatus Peregrinibacteria bacterium GW2011_GWA2_44_7]